MTIKFIILVLVFALVNLHGHSQTNLATGVYIVDKQITLQIKKFTYLDSGQLKNSMHISVPWDEKKFFDQSLDCFTEANLKSDSILITGYMPGQLGWGFQLLLIKDSFIVAPFGLSDGQVYKHTESDTTYSNSIFLPCRTHKVILSKKPSYEEGEIVEGLVELNSYPYYYNKPSGEFKIELKAYFKTAPLKKND